MVAAVTCGSQGVLGDSDRGDLRSGKIGQNDANFKLQSGEEVEGTRAPPNYDVIGITVMS